VSETVVAADYDLDGRVDLLVTNGLNLRPQHRNNGPYQLFKNTSPLRNWVEVDLVGTNSNRDGIGARVYATAGGVIQYRAQDAGYHRWSQNQQRIHFGLASNATFNPAVWWPSGRVDSYHNLAANHIYKATEAGGIQQVNYLSLIPHGESHGAELYHGQMVAMLQVIWGEGFLPGVGRGGPPHRRCRPEGASVLDIGCGAGGLTRPRPQPRRGLRDRSSTWKIPCCARARS
jgi:hypothetical protein